MMGMHVKNEQQEYCQTTVQELLGQFDYQELVNHLMRYYIRPAHAKSAYSGKREQVVQSCLQADVREMLACSTRQADAVCAVTPDDMASLQGFPREVALSLPAIYPASYSSEDVFDYAASLVWELLEDGCASLQ